MKIDMNMDRNKPCFCGSGKKFKRCCFTGESEFLRKRRELREKLKAISEPVWRAMQSCPKCGMLYKNYKNYYK
jgi:hypothetical protein